VARHQTWSSKIGHRKPEKTLMKTALSACTLAGLIGIAGCFDAQELVDRRADELVSILGGDACVTLVAGRNLDVGTVCTSIVGDDLVVTYETTGDWTLHRAHLWIGTSLDDLPRTGSGRIRLQDFPYVTDALGDVTSHSFLVPLAALGGEPAVCDETFHLVAHAVVRRPRSNGGWKTRHAYGDGIRLGKCKKGARSFDLTLVCDGDPPGPGECETAFAVGDQTFVELGLTPSRWGWQITIHLNEELDAPLYAGAAQNDLTRGVHVGTLRYHHDGTRLRVLYEMFDGYTLAKTHVYAGTTPTTTIAPGQFGHGHDLGAATTDLYEIPLGGPPAYLVAHAVVCF
jgi:hypothetical protein